MDVLCSELYIFIHILSTSLHNNSSHTQNIQNIVQTPTHFTTVLCSTSQPFVYDYTFSVDEHPSFSEKHPFLLSIYTKSPAPAGAEPLRLRYFLSSETICAIPVWVLLR